MAVISLLGLRGLAGLSSQERDSFLQEHGLSGKGLTFLQKNRAYMDYLYQQHFGIDNPMPDDPNERDKELFSSVVQRAFDEKYLGKASDEEYELWNSLSMEGKYDLLNSNILTAQLLDDLEKSNLESMKAREAEMQKVKDENWFVNAMMSSDPLATNAQYQAEKGMIGSNRENNQKRLQEIFERDKANRLAEAAPLAAQMYTQWQEALDNGQMTQGTIEEEFRKISPYLNHWKAFVGEEELKNFSFEDKMNAVALYYAVLQQTGDAGVAISAVDGGIQNYIAGLQDGWDKTKLFMGNLVTGTVGAIMNEVNGLLALGAGLYGATFGDGFDEEVKNFLTSDWALYWDGVDNFNTFSVGAINLARENGGVSANQRIRAIGTEHDMDLNTVYDMGAMAKFIIPALLSKGAVSFATKGVNKVAMGMARRAVRAGLKPTTARATLKFINGATGLAGTLESGVGISNAYAMGTFNEALAEGNQKIDALIDNHVQRLIAQYVAAGGDVVNLSDADYAAMREKAEFELNVGELRHQNELAATDSYIVNATLEAPRMALENALFRKWMLSKGTKANLGMENPYLRVAERGGNLTMLNKWQNRLKPVLNNVWGGFESNYMDDVTARFGKEWGLANYNNYIVQNYDPELYAGVVEKYLNPLVEAAAGASEALGETQSFWDGFIGAGGSLIQLAPSGRWAKRMMLNRRDKKAGREVKQENRTFLEKLNDFIYNPILIEVEEAMARERNTSDRIIQVNKDIEKNQQNILDIVDLANGDSRAVLGARSGDMLTAADGKTKQLFELVKLYRKMQDDPIARESSQVKQMAELLERVSNSESIDDVADLVQTALSRPENQGTHPVTAEDLYSQMKDNASRFTAMANRLSEINKMFDENFDVRGVSEDFRNQLSYQLVMGENWQERLDKITEELGLNPSLRRNLSALMGSRKGFDAREREQTKVVEDIERRLKEAKEDLEDLNYKWTRPKKGKNGKKKQPKRVRNWGNKTEKALLKKEIETLERTRLEAQAKLDEIREFDADNVEVITADQMSSLSLEDLATMTDPNNRGYYSNAQLVEIDRFMDLLNQQDPTAAQKIQDANVLLKRIDDNKAAYSRLIVSPSEAEAWITNVKEERLRALMLIGWERQLTKASSEIAEMLNTNPLGIARKYGPDMLDEFVKRNPYMEDTIEPLRETSQLISDLTNYIELQDDFDEAHKTLAKETLYNLADGVGRAVDLVAKLERALQADNVDSFGKEVINRALDKAEQLGLQRSATVDRTRDTSTDTTDTSSPATDTAAPSATPTTPEATPAPTPTPTPSPTPTPTATETTTTPAASETQSVAQTIDTAINEGKSVRITYTNASGESSERTLSDIQYKNSRSQIEGMDSKRGERRTFRVDRITEATIVEDSTDTTTAPEPAVTETIEDTSVAPENIAETAEDVHVPTDEEIAASESTITTPDIDKVGEKYQEVDISEEIQLFDVLDIPTDQLSTQQEIADKVTSVTNPMVDTTDQGNSVPETNPQVLPGNKYPGYDYQVAEEEGVLQKPVSAAKGDRMDAIHQWLASIKTNLQDIIDNELTRILRVSPRIYFMGTKYEKSNDPIFDSLMMVVEYTPEVARIHKEENGGIITTNGKQYLLVGITGFDGRNREQMKYYQQMLKEHKAKRRQFFTQNNTEQYFVDESQYTERKDATSGRLIRQMNREEPIQMRRVSELLVNDPAVNPFGITSLGELHWGIQYATGFKFVNEPTTGIAYPPTDASTNVGSVFIMMEAANGNFIPAAIAPALYKDLKEGSRLKTQIDLVVAKLFSPNLGDRLAAEKQLRMMFSLEKTGKWILVGNERHNTITFLDHDVEVAKIDLDNPAQSSADFMEAFKVFNPRVSITTSILGNKTALRMYDEAGALMTDVAKLGTSAANYTVYPIGPDGTPIKTEAPFNGRPNLDANSDLAKAEAKQGMTEFYQGTQYRKRNGQWYKYGSNEPLTGALALLVEYSNKVRDLEPDITAPGRGYYVLNGDRNNPLVVRKNTDDNTVRLLNKEESLKVIDRIAQNQEETRRQAAQEEALRAENEGRVPTDQDVQVSLEDVNLDNADVEIASQLTGNFTQEAERVEAATEEIAPTRESEESVLSSEDINSTSEASMDELQGTRTPSTAAGIAASREYGDRLFAIAEAKLESGEWQASEEILDDYVALVQFLESKGIKVNNIDNVEGWLKLVEECK